MIGIECPESPNSKLSTLDPINETGTKQNEPATHQIEINLKAIPTQFVKALGAGVCFEHFNKLLQETLVPVRRVYIPGTRSRPPKLVGR